MEIGLYGYRADLPALAHLSAEERMRALAGWGFSTVFPGRDDEAAVEAARAEGLRVFLEFPCFTGRDLWRRFPDSRPVCSDGSLLEPVDGYCGVNPAHPAVRADRLAALEVLMDRFRPDGLWLDFIRWPCRWERPQPDMPAVSFDPATVALFATEIGVGDLPRDPVKAAARIRSRHAAAWEAWRCRRVESWVADARRIVHDRGATLGLFSVPWRVTDFGGAVMSTIGQDFRALAAMVDVISPMVYHLMCGREVEWIADVISDLADAGCRRIWPIIQAVDVPSPLSAPEYRKAADAVLSHGQAEGLLVFHAEGALQGPRADVTRRLAEPARTPGRETGDG